MTAPISRSSDSSTQKPFQRSKYNFFVERDGGYIVFNARKGSFTFVSKKIGLLLQGDGSLDGLINGSTLLEMGVVCQYDELEEIKKTYHAGVSSSATLSVALVPTMSCNLKCGYCYQSEYRNERRMSAETQSFALEYVRSKLRQGWKDVDCTWYGGEPLLEKEMIYDLSFRLRKIAEDECGRLLPMKIVTNGVLLDEETAKKLSEAGVYLVQVTLDSLIDDEYSLRGALSKDGALSVITKNILIALKYLKVQIRINVSKVNKGEVQEILDVLRRQGLYHLISVERVTNLEAESGAVVDSQGSRFSIKNQESSRLIFPIKHDFPTTLNRKEFAKFETNLLFNDPSHVSKMVQRLTPKTKFCGATAGNLFVLDPDGNISRCWHSAGSHSESVGNVRWEQTPQNLLNNQKWDSVSPFLYSTCSSCKVLPLCMGGCSHPRLFMDSKISPCESIKFQVQACVDVIGSHIELPCDEYSNEKEKS